MRNRRQRQPLTLERLEERTLLAGNLLITSEVPGAIAYNLKEYTQQGVQVSSQPIPQAPGSNEYEDARGLSVGPSGDINIYDGTFTPSLATLSAATNTWSFQTLAGWSTVNNISYGEVVAYKNFVFASDMGTAGGQANGIVRFDSSGGPAVRLAPGTDFIQVALGRDGLLYGLGGSGDIHVFDPDTLAAVRTFSLSGGPDSDIRSLAVDSSGQVLAATWGGFVAKYDPNGHFLASTQLKSQYGYGENLMNIALDSDGQVAVGGRDGDVFLTNEALTPATTIQTNQWDVFVTFDHYIGSVPRLATPSFDSLAGPTITYGQASTTLGGRITAGTTYPSGDVNITVNGVTQSAVINAADGTFSAAFDTSTLGVSASPYTITYSYPGDSNDTAIQDSSQSLTVTPATTTLGFLSAPTVVFGTPTVVLSGVVGSNSVLPVGQAVAVTVSGANGPVASGSGTIGSDGSFSVTLNSSALAAGSYTITYSYAGNANFSASQGAGTLQVSYAIVPLYNTTKPIRAGSTLDVNIRVTNASGSNVSSASLTVTAVMLVDANGKTFIPHPQGGAYSGNEFRKVKGGYEYKLNTTGLAAGKYSLLVRVGNDPVFHALSFVVG